jgi:hypothetical protein
LVLRLAGGTGGMRLFSIAFSFAEWDNAHLPIRFSVCDCFKSRRRLEAEILVRRHQLNVSSAHHVGYI